VKGGDTVTGTADAEAEGVEAVTERVTMGDARVTAAASALFFLIFFFFLSEVAEMRGVNADLRAVEEAGVSGESRGDEVQAALSEEEAEGVAGGSSTGVSEEDFEGPGRSCE
jgi:hypothetical protein